MIDKAIKISFFALVGVVGFLALTMYMREFNQSFQEAEHYLDISNVAPENIFKEEGEPKDPIAITPEPLEVEEIIEHDETLLSVEGVISSTNDRRLENDQNPLVRNDLLSVAAENKLDDMFDREYFAHDAPDGTMGVKELANGVGYDYLVVGENLAMGVFSDNEDLVQAWMDSPGHRENILSDSYTEIGVAVDEGHYRGKEIWIAVQLFGMPGSSCTEPDPTLQGVIESNETELKTLVADIEQRSQAIEDHPSKSGEQYNQMVEEYNDLVDRYNELLHETSRLTDRYNAQVTAYNDCIKI